MIEPFFFGPRNAFACYRPSSELASQRLLVICPPLFDEYRRCYRALSDLANACAMQGMHVIRLDYSGTGESAGTPADFTVKDWIDDIHCAIEEGIALTGAESIALAGVRFGATLAMQCSHQAVKYFVLWDPVASGEEYSQWLSAVDREIDASHRSLAKMANEKFEEMKYELFELGEKLKAGIAALSVNKPADADARPVNVVTTNKTMVDNNEYAHCEFTGFEYDWPRFHEGNLHPTPVLERIARIALQQ